MASELDGPGARQVFAVQRRVVQTATGLIREETVVGITSLAPARAGARALARSVRQHWHSENRSHWVRDLVFREDASRSRTVPIPQVLAALRNAIIGLLHACGYRMIQTTLLDFQAHPADARALLGIQFDN